MSKKPDQTKIDSLEKGLRNLSEHENPGARLLKIEKDIRHLKIHHWINFIFLMITIFIISLLGAVLL